MTTDKTRFEIVFQKLEEAQQEQAKEAQFTIRSLETSVDELREIDELRRFAMQLAETPPTFFTRT